MLGAYWCLSASTSLGVGEGNKLRLLQEMASFDEAGVDRARAPAAGHGDA